jgi:CDGSH-type Zn-finger protein
MGSANTNQPDQSLQNGAGKQDAAPTAMEPTSSATTPEALEMPAGVHHLCSCGRSRQGWFCDGAHLGTGRIAYELRLEEPATVLLCRCGRSRRYPLCDGSHGKPRRRWWG